MRNRHLIYTLSFFFAAFLLLLCQTTPLFAQVSGGSATNKWEKVFQGLLDRQYYDVAIDYLNACRNESHCPVDWKEQIDFQLGLLHYRNSLVTEAKSAFLRFLETAPEHDFASTACLILGKTFLDEAITVKQQEILLEKLASAGEFFTSAEQLAYRTAKELKEDPETKNNVVKRARRDRAYAELLDSRIKLALVFWEQAKTVSPDSPQYKTGLNQATEKFHDLAVKYKDFAASLESKLYEAQVLFELGHFAQARTLLGELNILPRSNELYEMILDEALYLTLAMNLAEPPRPQLLIDSRERLDKWIESVNKNEQSQPQKSKINLYAGKTYLSMMKLTRGQEARTANRTAQKFLRAVSPESPEFKEAQELLSSLGIVDQEKEEKATGSLNDFEELKKEANEKYQQFLQWNHVFSQTETGTDRFRAETLREKAAQEAIAVLQVILENDNLSVSERNIFRAQEAVLYLGTGQFEEAVVLGEFLGRNSLETDEKILGAEIALKGLQHLLVQEQSGNGETDWILTQMAGLTDWVARQDWGWRLNETVTTIQRDAEQAMVRENPVVPESEETLFEEEIATLRNENRFEELLDRLLEKLRKMPDSLPIQFEVARTFQELGGGDKKNYTRAILGTDELQDGQKLVWGWNGIIKQTSGRTGLDEPFYFDAYWNKTECRLLLAKQSSPSEAVQLLGGAEKELLRLQQLRPDLGGIEGKQRFTELLQQIRKNQAPY